MKIFNINTALLPGLLLFLVAPSQADAQGLFKRLKKSPDPGSASLFPSASAPGYVTSSEPSAPQDSAIFKDGQPHEVKATSYYIRNGEKVEKADKKRGPFFGFGRKKEPENVEAPASTYRNETPEFNSTPAIVAQTPENLTPEFVPASAPVPQKERKFGFPGLQNLSLPALPKFHRKDQGPIDTTGAEILVNRGGTLAPSGTAPQDEVQIRTVNSAPSNSATAAPPRNEDGSIIYSSWDDVTAKKSSAADQIVRDMKAQEAAHKAKIEAAKREYEEQRKKAEADARIRAIMQGSMIPPGS